MARGGARRIPEPAVAGADALDPARPAPDEERSRRIYAFTGAFFEALRAGGLRHVVLSPGSRSTPLTLTAARDPGLRTWVLFDERSAGFFALGLARAERRPVALVCTSGSAAANYLPAVVEARHARLPLLVLTADRPPELRDRGAGQTIDQIGLYGSQVRDQAELPIAGEPGAEPVHAAGFASRALARATASPPGPVHLNWPFREPFDPPRERPGSAPGPPPAARVPPRSPGAPAPEAVTALAAEMARIERGLLVCGPGPLAADAARAVAALSAAAGWPVLADPLSGLRAGPAAEACGAIATADLALRAEGVARALRPEAVLRIGDSPTSKPLRRFLETARPERHWLVDPDAAWHDPAYDVREVLRADTGPLCRELARALGAPEGASPRGHAWRARWSGLDDAVEALRARHLGGDGEACEASAVRAVVEALPPETTLFVSSSMPVRDLDLVLPRRPEALGVLANRGANGIDGIPSSALGVCAASSGGGPCVLLCGDLAFLHDLGGWWAARRYALPLVAVVLDNGGGGIFDLLPVAERCSAEEMDRLFRVPHGLDLADAARLFGLSYEAPDSLAHLRRSLASLGPGGGPRLIHVRLDAARSHARRRALVEAVQREFGEGGPP